MNKKYVEIICNKRNECDLFKYAERHIYDNYKKIICYCYGEDINTLNNFARDDIFILNGDSNMLLEPFTVGTIINNDWQSSYERDYNALILSHSNNDVVNKKLISKRILNINLWRSLYWKNKPIYLFTNMSLNCAKKAYNNLNINFRDIRG
jgi:hypothetical protein